MKRILFMLTVAILFSACHYFWGKRVSGDGVIKSMEKSVSAFKEVEVGGAFKVYVEQGDLKPLTIEGDENLLQYVEVRQEGETIHINTRQGYNLRPSADMKIYLHSPAYSRIDVSGACDIIGDSKINNPENLELSGSGASKISMDVNAPRISAEISGGGTINLKGQTRAVDLAISGAGDAHCFDLQAESAKITISGAGSADVFASVSLEADISGAGSIHYKGGGQIVKQQISGAGSINKAD